MNYSDRTEIFLLLFFFLTIQKKRLSALCFLENIIFRHILLAFSCTNIAALFVWYEYCRATCSMSFLSTCAKRAHQFRVTIQFRSKDYTELGFIFIIPFYKKWECTNRHHPLPIALITTFSLIYYIILPGTISRLT